VGSRAAGGVPPTLRAHRFALELGLAVDGAISSPNVDLLAAFGILAGLVLLLVWTRRRWGQPRLHVRGAVALWLLAASLSFRLDQVDAVDDTGELLVLRFEERDGIAQLARCTANGLDVELHHILTFT
jgi:hypothetical protein